MDGHPVLLFYCLDLHLSPTDLSAPSVLCQVPIILVAWLLNSLFFPFDLAAPPCFNYSGFMVRFDVWQVKCHLIVLLFQNVLESSCLFTLSDKL